MNDDFFLDEDTEKAIKKSEDRLRKEQMTMVNVLRQEMAGALAVTAEQQLDLADLKAKDPKMDWREVVKAAQKENLSDMKKAYEACYGEEKLRTKIKAELEEKYQKVKELSLPGRRVLKIKKQGGK